MRTFILGVLFASSIACSDSTAPEKGTIVFTVDALTCPSPSGGISIDFFIDGKKKTTASLEAGDSKSFTTSAGQHAIAARVTNTTYTWGPQAVSVPRNDTYTWLMFCP
jgi:hypothetical protein